MIRSELVLLKMNDSSYASTKDFFKTYQNELKLGSIFVASPTQSPGTSVF